MVRSSLSTVIRLSVSQIIILYISQFWIIFSHVLTIIVYVCITSIYIVGSGVVVSPDVTIGIDVSFCIVSNIGIQNFYSSSFWKMII